MLENTDVGTIAVGGTAMGVFGVWAFRKAWQSIIGTKVDTALATTDQSKLVADKQLFDNLREEVARQGLELKQVRLDAKSERLELENRIAELESKIMRLTFHLGSIRRHAIDAYSSLVSIQCDHKCKNIDKAIEHLKAIMEED